MRLRALLIVFIYINFGYAVTCTLHGGGEIDNYLNQFTNIISQWQNVINPLAQKFFFILFGAEFMWQLTVNKVFAGDIEKLWVFFFTRTVLCFFFARYLVNIKLYEDIINYLSNLGTSLGGYSLNVSKGKTITTISPSAVMSSFSCITDIIKLSSDQGISLASIPTWLVLGIIQVLFFIVLIFISFYLLRIILQTYLIIYVGFFFAGFAGSSWTFSYWQRYLSTVISVGIKFLVVCIIMGVMTSNMQVWVTKIVTSGNNVSVLVAQLLQGFGTAIIMLLCLWQLPEWFAATLTGSINSGITNPLQIFKDKLLGGINRVGSIYQAMPLTSRSSTSNSNTNSDSRSLYASNSIESDNIYKNVKANPFEGK